MTPTFYGDTGMWDVPTADVLSRGTWSTSAYRRGANYVQGYTNVADVAANGALGIAGNVELFGAVLMDSRVHHDVRASDRRDGDGRSWSGDQFGDCYIGAKMKVASRSRSKVADVALRAQARLSTGRSATEDTRGPDAVLSVVVSKDVLPWLDLAAYLGGRFDSSYGGSDVSRFSPDGGVGVAAPAHGPIRFAASATSDLVPAGVRRMTPAAENDRLLSRASWGVTYQHRDGLFVGTAVSFQFPTQGRDASIAADRPSMDAWDWQFRVGFHPGVRGF